MPRRIRFDKRSRITPDQEMELRAGPELAVRMDQSGEESTFPSEEARRDAWERLRNRLMAENPQPGRRPWGWWHFEGGREEYLSRYPGSWDIEDNEDQAAALDEYYAEPVRFLAAGGHLSRAEIAELRQKAEEAEARIGTGTQQGTSLGDGVWIGGDRVACAIGHAVEEGLERSFA